MFEIFTYYIKESYMDILTYINTMGIFGILLKRWLERVKVKVLVDEVASFFSFTDKMGLEIEIPITFENIGDQQVSISRIKASCYYFTNNPNLYNSNWFRETLKPIEVFFLKFIFQKKINFSHIENKKIILQSGAVDYCPIIIGPKKITPPLIPNNINYLLVNIEVGIVKSGIVSKKIIIRKASRPYN